MGFIIKFNVLKLDTTLACEIGKRHEQAFETSALFSDRRGALPKYTEVATQ